MNWKQIFFDFTSLIVLVAVGVGFYAAIKLDERAERKRIARISAPTMRRLLGIK